MNLTPRKIVEELDRFIVGQHEAKKAIAIAFRNRLRRKKVTADLRDEIQPKNILMIGPTGVGKTEIARRMAKIAGAPFLKVEATKYTEVGYVGRDVESMIRDLTEMAVVMTREKFRKDVKKKAGEAAEERVLDSLVGKNATTDTREKFRVMLHEGKLGDKEVELEVLDTRGSFSSFDIPGLPGGQMGVLNINDIIGKAMGTKTRPRRMHIHEALEVLTTEESDKLIDEEKIIAEAIERVENDGIIFLDEIDKIASRAELRGGEVSREGVQRDLLPLLEGSCVATKYGTVKTDHILFIASGAFHMSKPSDLLPELQGRLPIRVELKALAQEDLVRILKEPEVSLLKQYTALLATENVTLRFQENGIREIAAIAAEVNRNIENIGARRLQTVMEKLLEEVSFESGDESDSDSSGFTVTINAAYVQKQLGSLAKDSDLSKFIL